LTDERSKKSPNYVFFVTAVLNYRHVILAYCGLLDDNYTMTLGETRGHAPEEAFSGAMQHYNNRDIFSFQQVERHGLVAIPTSGMGS